MEFEFLNKHFLEAMNDIGRYGNEKYGDQSFHVRAKLGDRSRGCLERCTPLEIERHAKEHFEQYQVGLLHDHFHTRKHQLAAAAFNAMMEFYYADLENEGKECGYCHGTREVACSSTSYMDCPDCK